MIMSIYRETYTVDGEKMTLAFSNDEQMVESQIMMILEWANREENSPLKTLSFNRVGHEFKLFMMDAQYEGVGGTIVSFTAQLDCISERIVETLQTTFK